MVQTLGGNQRRRLSLRSSERTATAGAKRRRSSAQREHDGPTDKKQQPPSPPSARKLFGLGQGVDPESMSARAELLDETDWGFSNYSQLNYYVRDEQRLGERRSSIRSRECPATGNGQGKNEGLSERARAAEVSQLLQHTKFAENSAGSSITPTYRREKLQPQPLDDSARLRPKAANAYG